MLGNAASSRRAQIWTRYIKRREEKKYLDAAYGCGWRVCLTGVVPSDGCELDKEARTSDPACSTNAVELLPASVATWSKVSNMFVRRSASLRSSPRSKMGMSYV